MPKAKPGFSLPDNGSSDLFILHSSSFILRAALAVVLALAVSVSSAQTYPSRSIRLVVPWPAGGPPDAMGRLLGQRVGEALKQQIVVDNRPGANSAPASSEQGSRLRDENVRESGCAPLNSPRAQHPSAGSHPLKGHPCSALRRRIGTEIVAKSPPDGYTYLLTTGSHTTNAALHTKLPYDTLQDFVALTLVGETAGMVFGVHPSIPAKSVKELVALAKAKPGQLTFGSAGNGNTLHLAGELFKAATGVNITHVPYKGAAPALNDLLGGHIDMMFASPVSMTPPIKAGRLRGLAQMGARRSHLLPELPTLGELGIRGAEIGGWYGLYAPAKTPREYTDRMLAEVMKALKESEIKERINNLGVEPVGMPQDEFMRYLVADIDKYKQLAKRINLKLD